MHNQKHAFYVFTFCMSVEFSGKVTCLHVKIVILLLPKKWLQYIINFWIFVSCIELHILPGHRWKAGSMHANNRMVQVP